MLGLGLGVTVGLGVIVRLKNVRDAFESRLTIFVARTSTHRPFLAVHRYQAALLDQLANIWQRCLSFAVSSDLEVVCSRGFEPLH